MASSISSAVNPFDSRKETFFAKGADWTLGSDRKDTADWTRSSRIWEQQNASVEKESSLSYQISKNSAYNASSSFPASLFRFSFSRSWYDH